MGKTFFTADQHFGHANIIKHCERPFTKAKEMDEAMIAKWNEVITDADLVYHLGDFSLKSARAVMDYFAQLNGYIKLIAVPWHHDAAWLPRADLHVGGYRLTDLRSATGVFVELLPPEVLLRIPSLVKDGYAKPLHLSHYPLAAWDAYHHGGWHLHGHSHGRAQVLAGRLDVGVDAHSFYPVSLDEVIRVLSMTQEERESNASTQGGQGEV